jgi:hypothetical protein
MSVFIYFVLLSSFFILAYAEQQKVLSPLINNTGSGIGQCQPSNKGLFTQTIIFMSLCAGNL